MEVPHVPDPAALRLHVRLSTRWSDEDNQGVLNNAVYLTLFEEARHRYFGRLGLLAHNQFPFLLAQTNVAFVAPGKGGVEVVVEIGTTQLGRTSFTQAYRVRDGQTGAVWCEAEARLVIYDPGTGAKAAMPEAFRAAIVAFETPSC